MPEAAAVSTIYVDAHDDDVVIVWRRKLRIARHLLPI